MKPVAKPIKKPVKGPVAKPDDEASPGVQSQSAWATSYELLSFGSEDWVTPENVTADDSSYAAYSSLANPTSAWSKVLACKGFGFTIPAGATIVGVELTAKCGRDAVVSGVSKIDFVVKPGSSSIKEYDTPEGPSGGDVLIVAGGPTDLWDDYGDLELTPTKINNDGAGGFRAGIIGHAGENLPSVLVNAVMATIYYTE